MFELKHLKSIKVLDETASLKSAANVLAMSQSALSHQLKDLEYRLDQKLFERNSSPIKWSVKGQQLLALAKQVLPLIEQVTEELKPNIDKSVKLTVSIACHACFQWLFSQLSDIQASIPKLTLEFDDVTFEQVELASADILLTDEHQPDSKFCYKNIGSFELFTIVPDTPHWQEKQYVKAADFADQTLLSYPVPKQRLDIYSHVLTPNNIEPKQLKPVANTHVILQMIANGMGIATLPSWVFSPSAPYPGILKKRIGLHGVHKSLYVRYNQGHKAAKQIEKLIPKIITAFEQVTRAT